MVTDGRPGDTAEQKAQERLQGTENRVGLTPDRDGSGQSSETVSKWKQSEERHREVVQR